MFLLQRIEITITVLLLFGSAVLFFKALQFRRVRIQVRQNHLPPTIKHGEPALLYFWTQECSQCKSQEYFIEQAQAVLHLQGQTVTMYKFNALQEHELSRQIRVMTVPTTVLVDRNGEIAAWNPGLTPTKKLIAQFLALP